MSKKSCPFSYRVFTKKDGQTHLNKVLFDVYCIIIDFFVVLSRPMDIIAIINTSFHLSISFLYIGTGWEPGSGYFGRNHSKIELFSQYLFTIPIILYQNIYYFDSYAERKKS